MKVVDKLEKFYDRNLILVVEGETNYCEYMSESEKELVERLKERNNFTGKKGEVLSLNFIQNDRLISMDIFVFVEISILPFLSERYLNITSLKRLSLISSFLPNPKISIEINLSF